MKWYKTAIDTNKLTQLATQFRKQMVKCYNDECLKSLCLPISRKLKDFLISKGFNTAIVVQGVFRVDNPDTEATADWDPKDFESPEEMEEATYTPLHYWVEVNDIIIDITANQFNDELDEPVSPVEIGTYSDLERYTAIHKDWI
jgi:hypothetical protein